MFHAVSIDGNYSFYNLAIEPYRKGIDQFKKGFDFSFQTSDVKISLKDRVKHILLGTALLLPIVNTIIVLAANKFISPAKVGPKIRSRKIPPVSHFDTVFFDKNDVARSIHGSGTLFFDKEILKVHEITKKETVEGIPVEFSKHGKAIIQQQGTRGCTAATAAMLIADNGAKFNPRELKERNLGNNENQKLDIAAAGLHPVETKVPKDLDKLAALIESNGSAIVGVGGELGGHVIVVDKVSKNRDKVRIRDPYHGWEITVTAQAFMKRFDGGGVIQVAK